jgi:hypothetical protein
LGYDGRIDPGGRAPFRPDRQRATTATAGIVTGPGAEWEHPQGSREQCWASGGGCSHRKCGLESGFNFAFPPVAGAISRTDGNIKTIFDATAYRKS